MVLQSNNERDTAAPLGGFTHSEILHQPELWPVTLDIVAKAGWSDQTNGRPVIITGAGTSAYAAAAIAESWPNATAVPTTDLLIESRTEIERRSPHFASSGLLISLARSGDSPESLAVVNRVMRICPEAEHLAITCNAEGQLAKTPRVASIILDPRTNDRSLAMTSSFSNLVLAGLCLRHRQEIEKVLPSLCANIQKRLPDLESKAKNLSLGKAERTVVLASGALTPLATETTLKILEMTAGRTATLCETFLGLRHGPMSFLNSDTLVLCFLSSSPDKRRYEEDLVSELRQKQLGRILGIVPEGSDCNLFHEWIPASAGQCRDEIRVPFEVPFAQLLAYHLSLRQGLDPDNPSPMGAITRVVKKFVIYDQPADV
jgi:tagatose-6-phosphate ketose/aldose isomerase